MNLTAWISIQRKVPEQDRHAIRHTIEAAILKALIPEFKFDFDVTVEVDE